MWKLKCGLIGNHSPLKYKKCKRNNFFCIEGKIKPIVLLSSSLCFSLSSIQRYCGSFQTFFAFLRILKLCIMSYVSFTNESFQKLCRAFLQTLQKGCLWFQFQFTKLPWHSLKVLNLRPLTASVILYVQKTFLLQGDGYAVVLLKNFN